MVTANGRYDGPAGLLPFRLKWRYRRDHFLVIHTDCTHVLLKDRVAAIGVETRQSGDSGNNVLAPTNTMSLASIGCC